jgi:hypothetical protein
MVIDAAMTRDNPHRRMARTDNFARLTAAISPS